MTFMTGLWYPRANIVYDIYRDAESVEDGNTKEKKRETKKREARKGR